MVDRMISVLQRFVQQTPLFIPHVHMDLHQATAMFISLAVSMEALQVVHAASVTLPEE